MINKTIYALITISSLILSFSSMAHEQEKHAPESAQANCETMDNMKHSEMDMNDPVIQAMMEKCASQPKDKGNEQHDSQSHKDHSN